MDTWIISFLGDSLFSIEPHLNLLKYDYIVVPPPNEFCELYVSKLKCVQRFLTLTTKSLLFTPTP
jgi:hypothetical protein